ncbi:MAG: rhomboid family intramembrane serine protease [Synechococcaceae cyanobacterium]|nr:rhomboid family intramembrane serine protease [Synechococcaceae cyanobacterium]
MGKGEELGRELRHWITVDRWHPASGPALANRLIDLLGEQDTLKAPLRDLAAQPQFLTLLRQPQPASAAAVESLCGLLARTYAPGVLAELRDLIHVGTGFRSSITAEAGGAAQPAKAPEPSPIPLRPQPDPGSAAELVADGASSPRHPPFDDTAGAPLGVANPSAAAASLPRAAAHAGRLPWSALVEELIAIAPGLALGFSVSLVLAWAAAQLDQALLDRWGWSGGVTLAVALLALQIGSSGPLRRLRRQALLSLPSSAEPRLAWRWFTAPWLHARGGEALTHVLLLLILLGPSPLPLNQVVLRYSLTALATEALAVLSARTSGMTLRRWGGAAGPVASLIGLAACLSLLHWRELSFRLGLPGQLDVPAWVLLVIYASLQLAWQLPRTSEEDTSRPGDRLWSSTWWWGSLLGVGWGLLTWCSQAIGLALQQAGGR